MTNYVSGLGFVVLLGCSAGGFGNEPSPPSEPVFVGIPTEGGSGFGVAGASAMGGGFSAGQPPLRGAVFSASRPPPPTSGGTLLVLKDQKTALVADPDHDQLVIVNLETMTISSSIALDPGDEPGRAAEDADGHVHVVLRGTGSLSTIDPATGQVLGSRDVCRYPRGLAVSDAENLVHVACAEGRLISLPTAVSETGPVRDLMLDRDLRDVVLAQDGLWVSRFRSAQVLRLDAAGKLLARYGLPGVTTFQGHSPATVAWRMVSNDAGGVVVVHQRALAGEVIAAPGGYGSEGGPSIVESAISEVHSTGDVVSSGVTLAAPLPVDIARSGSGDFLVASAAFEHPDAPSFIQRTPLVHAADLDFSETPQQPSGFSVSDEEFLSSLPEGPLVGVAFASGVPVMQFREPGRLVFGTRGVALPGDGVTDAGNTMFHLRTGSGLACASCHPEGQEDGHVWNFSGFGPRRTQSLRGGLMGTEPFHWDGLETDFASLTNDVMAGRMGGPLLSPGQADLLARYIDRLPALTLPTVTTPAIERGKALFEDAKVGCATCHSGARFTNNATVDAGSGLLQVPGLLGLWAREPYLHDGCAENLMARFTRCNTSGHGNLTQVSADGLADLVAYLETL